MGTRKVRAEVYTIENLVACLLKAPNRMLNTQQLYDMSKIADKSTFTKYLYQANAEGEIRVASKEEIQNEEEKKRLNIGPKKATKVWTVTDKVYIRK